MSRHTPSRPGLAAIRLPACSRRSPWPLDQNLTTDTVPGLKAEDDLTRLSLRTPR